MCLMTAKKQVVKGLQLSFALEVLSCQLSTLSSLSFHLALVLKYRVEICILNPHTSPQYPPSEFAPIVCQLPKDLISSALAAFHLLTYS